MDIDLPTIRIKRSRHIILSILRVKNAFNYITVNISLKNQDRKIDKVVLQLVFLISPVLILHLNQKTSYASLAYI